MVLTTECFICFFLLELLVLSKVFKMFKDTYRANIISEKNVNSA